MKSLIKFIKYHFDEDYRHKVERRRKFMQIMQVNKSIMEGLK